MDAIVALNGIFSPCELIFNVNAVFELIKSRSMAVAVDPSVGILGGTLVALMSFHTPPRLTVVATAAVGSRGYKFCLRLNNLLRVYNRTNKQQRYI